jgi:membrane-associated phospholipid phosphatase
VNTSTLDRPTEMVRQDENDPLVLGTVAKFDRAVAAAARRLDARPSIHLVSAVLSNLADYGFLWAVIAAFKARRSGPRRRQAIAALAMSGVLSAGVNATIKSVVRRQRPGLDEPTDQATRFVRAPTSSSFPSGHTLAAFCTANALAESDVERVLFVTFAGAVGASRVHLGAHHASDVLGGAAIGGLLGLVVRSVLKKTR